MADSDEDSRSVVDGTISDYTPTVISTDIRDEDTIKILIATDNHLGFSDLNPAREDDSFTTFEEILATAKTQDVDFLLLGGDLFHENKPKPATFQRAIDLLHLHVLGEKPVQFEYLGNPEKDFSSTSTEPQVNYLNPNLNIGLPIFTIHGNHDDPIGGKRTSVVDHLAAAGLVNHFGQWGNLHEIDVQPVLLRKGLTNLALFGLGHMKDERLYRLMRDNKVQFLRPNEDADNWFNLFVLHQNHAKHGPKSYFPEQFLPHFLDYVIWGHEHECFQKESEFFASEDKRIFILQPGSSVATSLAEGESREKGIVLLQINKRNFKSTFLRLETVRPFVWHELKLADILSEVKTTTKTSKGKSGEELRKYIETYIETHIRGMIDEAAAQLTGHPNQPTEPLIRLRIEYENEEDKFNTYRFSQQFKEHIANEDIITFKRRNARTEDDGTVMSIGAIREMINNLDDQELGDLGAHVEEIVEKHFLAEREKPDGQILEILSDKGLSEAVRSCVDKDDKESVNLIIDAQVKGVVDYLMRKPIITLDNIEQEIADFRRARNANNSATDVEELDETALIIHNMEHVLIDDDQLVIEVVDQGEIINSHISSGNNNNEVEGEEVCVKTEITEEQQESVDATNSTGTDDLADLEQDDGNGVTGAENDNSVGANVGIETANANNLELVLITQGEGDEEIINTDKVIEEEGENEAVDHEGNQVQEEEIIEVQIADQEEPPPQGSVARYLSRQFYQHQRSHSHRTSTVRVGPILQTVCIIDPNSGETTEHQVELVEQEHIANYFATAAAAGSFPSSSSGAISYELIGKINPQFIVGLQEGQQENEESVADDAHGNAVVGEFILSHHDPSAETEITEISNEEEEAPRPRNPHEQELLDKKTKKQQKNKGVHQELPFGFQGQELTLQTQRVLLNAWHYFKKLKKCPQLLQQKNAQGLAADALNIGPKTIGSIGKRYRQGLLREGGAKIKRFKFHEEVTLTTSPFPVIPQPTVSTVDHDVENHARALLAARKAIRRSGSGNNDSDGDGDRSNEIEDVEMDEEVDEIDDDDEEERAAPSKGRGRGGRGSRGGRGGAKSNGTSSKAAGGSGRGRGSRGGAGGSRGRGGKGSSNGSTRTVQTTIPILRTSPRKANTSAVVFDDSDED